MENTSTSTKFWFQVSEVKVLDKALKKLMEQVGEGKIPWPEAREQLKEATNALQISKRE